MGNDSFLDLDSLFRRSYSKIVAAVLRVLGPNQLDLAEASAQESFLRAVDTWPTNGRPDEPLSWLIRVAHNYALNEVRKTNRHSLGTPDELVSSHSSASEIDDDLKLLFLCCHPALTQESQLALMLKIGCGFSVAEIARLFLVDENAVAQRLVRAKRLIRDSEIPFELPDSNRLPEHLETVMNGLYGLFNEGYGATSGDALLRRELCSEAIYLTEQLARMEIGASAQLSALLALFYFHVSRIESRVGNYGELLTLREQDRAVWRKQDIIKGMVFLREAMNSEALTRFHLEAGIAAAHAMAPSWEATDWKQIRQYYEWLEALHPTLVVRTNYVAATLFSEGHKTAQALAQKFDLMKTMKEYYLTPAILAEILISAGDKDKAEEMLLTSLKSVGNEVERTFLKKKIATIRAAATK